MEYKGYLEDSEVPGIIDQIVSILIDSWPLIRKTIVNMGALQEISRMPISHIQLLSLLSRVKSLSITQISERFGIAKPNITPMVDRMVSEKLVERVRCEADKRVVSIVICQKGRERLREICEGAAHIVGERVSSMSKDELGEFLASLQSLVRLLDKYA